MDFNAAGQPGRGSDVGDFVRGKNGGWVPRNHPDAMVDEEPQRHALPTEETAPAGGGAGVGGGGMSAALAGLRSAASPAPVAPMTETIAAPNAANPNLGQRIPPISMRQLAAMLPRIY